MCIYAVKNNQLSDAMNRNDNGGEKSVVKFNGLWNVDDDMVCCSSSSSSTWY